jgi:hypothetical protein
MLAHVPRLAVVLLLVTAAAEASPSPTVTETRRLSPRTEGVMAAYSATYDGELTTRDLRLRGGVPVLRGDGFGIGLVVGYGVTHLDVATEDLHDSFELHRFEATLGGGATLAPGRSLRASIGTAHASDLHESTWRALQLTSSAMVHWVLGPDDAVVVGAVYTSTAEFLPVLPILGYVHQRDGSRFRFDAFLPRHVRAEYELHPCIRGAIGVEAMGNTWALAMRSQARMRRAGGSLFGELGFALTQLMRLEARVGLSVAHYELPSEASGAMLDASLRPAGFAQLALLLAP